MKKTITALEDYIVKTACGVDLILSNSQLYTLERNLCFVDFRERVLSQYIDTIRGLYDYIVNDCMPQIGSAMINVFMCADSIIIPTQVEQSSARGLTELMKHFQTIRKFSNVTPGVGVFKNGRKEFKKRHSKNSITQFTYYPN